MQCACTILSCVPCPAVLYFSTLHHKRHDFFLFWVGGNTEHKMCVLIFSTTIVRKFSLYKKNSARYDQKCILVFMQSASQFCPIITKFEFSRQIFDKYPNIRFDTKSLKWEMSCSIRTGRQT